MTAVLTRQQPAGLVTAAGAASVAIRALVLGPDRPVAVLAAFPSAIYLSTGDGTVVALVTNDAVRLPCAIVVSDVVDLPITAASHEAPLEAAGGGPSNLAAEMVLTGDTAKRASVGAGGVVVGQLRVEVARWWLPMPPAPPPDSVVLARGLGALSERLAVQQHRLLRVVAEPTRRLEAAVRTRDPRAAAEATTSLLGLGPGLTPSGDDVLAGMLVGLHHLEWTKGDWRPAEPGRVNGRSSHSHVSVAGVRDAIANRVLADAPTRTTTLSAALLAHAAHGEAAGEVTAVLNSLCGRRPLSPALMRLLAVGHSSGYDMACGILAAGRALLGQRDTG